MDIDNINEQVSTLDETPDTKDHKINIGPIRAFVKWYRRLPNNQKGSLAALALIVMAIPFGVTAAMNQVRNNSKAYLPISPPIQPSIQPSLTPQVSPTISPRPATSPRSTASPRPSPTSRPTPTPVLPKPTPSPLPPSPSAASIPQPPTINNRPVIVTESLASGVLRKSYVAQVSGTDKDLTDRLNISASGLPAGLTLENCESQATPYLNMYSCQITGKPTKVGSFKVTILLNDDRGALTRSTLTLNIRRFSFPKIKFPKWAVFSWFRK